VLAKGQAGVYAYDQVKHLSPERLKRFFLRGTGRNEGLVKVRPELRAMIRFEQLNLTDADYGLRTTFDAIFCRNVMIYFDKPTQAQVLARFEPLMKPDGLLFAGHSENFTYVTQAFRLRGQTVYELTGSGARAARPARARDESGVPA
jgi:chemotaxis protein methyltransferase CheR